MKIAFPRIAECSMEFVIQISERANERRCVKIVFPSNAEIPMAFVIECGRAALVQV